MVERAMSVQYEQFKPFIQDIDGTATLVGAGAESRVYKVQLSSRDYVIKVAKENVRNARDRIMDRGLMTKAKIAGGLKGLGIDGLEQFVTGSIEDYAVIYQFVDGIQLNRATADCVDSITAEQKEQLIQTIAEATKAGLAFDGANPSGANAFYDPMLGFTLIDYSEAYWPISYKENWSAALRSLGPVALQAFADT